MVSNATDAEDVTNTSFRMNTRFELVPESGPIPGIFIKRENNYFWQFATYFFN